MSRFRRKLLVAATVLSGGTLFQLPSCVPFYAYVATDSLDFCSIFNCEGSTFFDLCGTFPLLADCPGAAGVDGDDGGDDDGAGGGALPFGG